MGLVLPTDNDAIFSSDPSQFYMYTDRNFEGVVSNDASDWESVSSSAAASVPFIGRASMNCSICVTAGSHASGLALTLHRITRFLASAKDAISARASDTSLTPASFSLASLWSSATWGRPAVR